MTNDSTTKGFLTPLDVTPPANDQALDRQLQQAVVGITGMTDVMVRPRWQTEPPAQPAIDANWCAVGIVSEESTGYPSITHVGTNTGHDELVSHETLNIMASFYGLNARHNAQLFRDGLFVHQNRETLRDQYGLQLISVGNIVSAPELTESGKWLKRLDVTWTVARAVTRTYGVRNIVSVDGVVTPEDGEDMNFSVPDRHEEFNQ